MNEAIIANFNEVIRPNDTLYLLGDIGWGDVRKWIERINGTKHLILGNHDKRKDYHKYFETVSDYKVLRYEKNHIILMHYPMLTWYLKNHGSYHCFGHCHGRLTTECRSMDVGVDTNNFYPYNLSDIIDKLNEKVAGGK